VELGLLSARGREIFDRLPRLSLVAELGSGSGEKLATLLEAGRRDDASLEVHLIDISASALGTASRVLSALGRVHVVTHQAPYEVGLEQLRAERRGCGSALALFLGSNIVNVAPPGADAFLHAV